MLAHEFFALTAERWSEVRGGVGAEVDRSDGVWMPPPLE